MHEKGASPSEIESTMNSAGSLKAAMLDGDLDNGIVSVSSAISFIKEVKTCKEIIEELMIDFKVKELEHV